MKPDPFLSTSPQPPPDFTSWFLGVHLCPLLLWILTVPLPCPLDWQFGSLSFPWFLHKGADFCLSLPHSSLAKAFPSISLAPQPCHEVEYLDRVLRPQWSIPWGCLMAVVEPRAQLGRNGLASPPPQTLHSLSQTFMNMFEMCFLRKLKPHFFSPFALHIHIFLS